MSIMPWSRAVISVNESIVMKHTGYRPPMVLFIYIKTASNLISTAKYFVFVFCGKTMDSYSKYA